MLEQMFGFVCISTGRLSGIKASSQRNSISRAAVDFVFDNLDSLRTAGDLNPSEGLERSYRRYGEKGNGERPNPIDVGDKEEGMGVGDLQIGTGVGRISSSLSSLLNVTFAPQVTFQ